MCGGVALAFRLPAISFCSPKPIHLEILMATSLFSPIKLAGVEFANRIVISPMCQYSADAGCANDCT
jgi:hypothetical protein